MQTSHTTIFHILTKEMEIRKVSAWWVLRMLTEDNHWNRMGAGSEILMQYNEEVGMGKIDNFSYRYIDNKYILIDNNRLKSIIFLNFFNRESLDFSDGNGATERAERIF